MIVSVLCVEHSLDTAMWVQETFFSKWQGLIAILSLFSHEELALTLLLLPPHQSHLDLVAAYLIHGDILKGCLRYGEAIPSYKKALEMSSLGTMDLETEKGHANILNGLSATYLLMGNANEAIKLCLEALHLLEKH